MQRMLVAVVTTLVLVMQVALPALSWCHTTNTLQFAIGVGLDCAVDCCVQPARPAVVDVCCAQHVEDGDLAGLNSLVGADAKSDVSCCDDFAHNDLVLIQAQQTLSALSSSVVVAVIPQWLLTSPVIFDAAVMSKSRAPPHAWLHAEPRPQLAELKHIRIVI